MKQKLIASITNRLESEIVSQNPVVFLKELPVEDIVDLSISIVYLYTRVGKGSMQTILMAKVITAIGHAIRNAFKLKRDSGTAARAGAFILYSFQILGMLEIKLGRASNGHATYILEVMNDDEISKLWSVIPTQKSDKLPSETPFEPWVSSRHPTGAMLVKTANTDVLAELTPERCPMVFECVNRAQQVGWKINEPIYHIYAWALRNKTEVFSEIWEMVSREAKQSKLREAKAIQGIAKRFIGKTFYH
jgi:hypothetical protein